MYVIFYIYFFFFFCRLHFLGVSQLKISIFSLIITILLFFISFCSLKMSRKVSLIIHSIFLLEINLVPYVYIAPQWPASLLDKLLMLSGRNPWLTTNVVENIWLEKIFKSSRSLTQLHQPLSFSIVLSWLYFWITILLKTSFLGTEKWQIFIIFCNFF